MRCAATTTTLPTSSTQQQLQLHKENYLNWNEKAHGTDWERAANTAAPATATAEADRRRQRRQQEIQRRQLEESFARMSRGAGPWVVRLPGGAFTGPDPWRSMQTQAPRRPPAGGGWSPDIAQVNW